MASKSRILWLSGAFLQALLVPLQREYNQHGPCCLEEQPKHVNLLKDCCQPCDAAWNVVPIGYCCQKEIQLSACSLCVGQDKYKCTHVPWVWWEWKCLAFYVTSLQSIQWIWEIGWISSRKSSLSQNAECIFITTFITLASLLWISGVVLLFRLSIW